MYEEALKRAEQILLLRGFELALSAIIRLQARRRYHYATRLSLRTYSHLKGPKTTCITMGNGANIYLDFNLRI